LERERRQREREEKIRLREEQKQKEREEQEQREIRCRRNETGPGKDGEPYVFKCICNNNELDIENNEIPLIVCEQCNTWMHIPCLAMKLLRLTEQPLELYNDDIEDWKRILFICPRCKAKELNIDYDKVIHKKKRGRPKLSKEELKLKRQKKIEMNKAGKEKTKGIKQARKKRKIITENGEITVIENESNRSANDTDDISTPSTHNSNHVTIVNSDGQIVKLSKYKLKKLEETPEQKAERERLKQERKEQRRQLRLEKKQQLKLERREQRRKERLERKEQEKLQKKLEREKLRQEKKEKLQLEKLISKMKKKNLVVFGPIGPDGQPPLLVQNQLKQHEPGVRKQSMQSGGNPYLNNVMNISNFSEGKKKKIFNFINYYSIIYIFIIICNIVY